MSTELDTVNWSLRNLCVLAPYRAGVTYLRYTVLMSPNKDESKQLSTVAILLYRFLSCLVSDNVFHVVSALQCIVFTILIGQFKFPARQPYARNHEKMNLCVFFSFLFGYGALLGGPLSRRSSTIKFGLLLLCSKHLFTKSERPKRQQK